MRHVAARLRRGRWAFPLIMGGRVRVHPLFVLLVVVAIGVGLWREVVVLFLLVALHELGHAAAAHQLGYTVDEVSLLPFGGVARLSYAAKGFRPAHEAAIAVAGPSVNVLLTALGWGMHAAGLWSRPFFHTVVELNLWIVVFNLLPGLPLDGGRVLRAARCRIVGYENATREAYAVAVLISVVLLCLGALSLWIGNPHLGMLVLGLFLLAAAWTGRRELRMDVVRFLDAKRNDWQYGTQLVRALAAPSTTAVKDVVREFSPDRYHMVYVRDESGHVVTIVEETELLEAVFAGMWLEPLERFVNQE